MVIDIKYIGAGFLGSALVFLGLSYAFESSKVEKLSELEKKREILGSLNKLESQWSKKAQEAELEQLYKLLDVFDVAYKKSVKRKRKVISMELEKHNADKIVSLVLNKNLNIKKIKLEKVGRYKISFVVEIL